MERQDFQNALGKFQTACIMDSQSDVGCLNMGIAFLYMQQYDDARRVLAKSASKDAKNPRAWFNLGLVERAVDQPKAALEDFEKTAALDPNDADTQYFIGDLLSKSEQYAKAAAAYSNAVKLNPFHASAELGLAEVGAAHGRYRCRARAFESVSPYHFGKSGRAGQRGLWQAGQIFARGGIASRTGKSRCRRFRSSLSTSPRASGLPDAPSGRIAASREKWMPALPPDAAVRSRCAPLDSEARTSLRSLAFWAAAPVFSTMTATASPIFFW